MKEIEPKVLDENKLLLARRIYLLLAALFIAALVTCNIIANKFVTIDLWFLGVYTISVGVLPYPITFLITDVLSEVYGRKRTNDVVLSGFVVSLFVLFLLWLGSVFPAIDNSPVQDEYYNVVFKNTWRVMGASMVAYLSAQFLDVRLFHFWKRMTKGKMLWVRNNFSTITSQFVDTVLVVSIIFVGSLSFQTIGGYILDGWIFKVICAAGDTVLIYIIMYVLRNLFGLKHGQEIKL